MEKKYKEILKSCSKKKSTMEALFGINKGTVMFTLKLIAVTIVLFLLDWAIINAILVSAGEPTLSFVDIFGVSIILVLLELAIFLILFLIVLELVVIVPLLLNTKYLPASEEEIKNLPFETQEEFFDFLYSLCRKKFCGEIWVPELYKLWFDIANTAIMYIKVHELKYSELKISEEMKGLLSQCKNWNSFMEELNLEEKHLHKSRKRR